MAKQNKSDKVALNIQVSRSTDSRLRAYASVMGKSLGEAFGDCVDAMATPEVIDKHLDELRKQLLGK